MNASKEEINEIVKKHLDQRWEEFKRLDYYESVFSERGFPSEKDLMNDFYRIRKCDCAVTPRTTIGLLIKYFHKSSSKAARQNSFSPYEYFEKLKSDEDLFKKFYTNRLSQSSWYNEKHGANRHFLEEGYVPPFIYTIGLTTSLLAPHVSMFKPTLAKNLIQKYLSKFDEIFDPFSGYSGRMLGTISLDKTYIGQDLNDETVKESNEILEFIKSHLSPIEQMGFSDNTKVTVADAFKTTGDYECMITCPPYADKNGHQIETWKNSRDEVIECEYDCDTIIEKCIDNYKCKKYLFIVDDSSEKFNHFVVEEIVNQGYINANKKNASKINKNVEKVILIER